MGPDVACNPLTTVVIAGSYLPATQSGHLAALVVSLIHLSGLCLWAFFDLLALSGIGPNISCADCCIFPVRLSCLAPCGLCATTTSFSSSPIHKSYDTYTQPRPTTSLSVELSMKLDSVNNSQHIPREDPQESSRISRIPRIIWTSLKNHIYVSQTPSVDLLLQRKAQRSQVTDFVVGMLVFGVVAPTMLVLSNELSLKANAHLLADASVSRSWTFGQVRMKLGKVLNDYSTTHYTYFQILPVILLLVPLVNIVQYIWETMWGGCSTSTEEKGSSPTPHV